MKGSLVDWVLRVSVAFAFLYPPFNALTQPDAWVGYFPVFVQGFVPENVLLHTFGILEVVLALWILSGWKVFLPAFGGAVLLFAIVLFNGNEFQVLFRDVSIAAAALALAVMHMPTKQTEYLYGK